MRDSRLLLLVRFFFYFFCSFTFLVSWRICTIRARGPAASKSWPCVEVLSPWPALRQEIQNSKFSAVGPRPGRIGSHSLLRSFCLSAARRRREKVRTHKRAIERLA